MTSSNCAVLTENLHQMCTKNCSSETVLFFFFGALWCTIWLHLFCPGGEYQTICKSQNVWLVCLYASGRSSSNGISSMWWQTAMVYGFHSHEHPFIPACLSNHFISWAKSLKLHCCCCCLLKCTIWQSHYFSLLWNFFLIYFFLDALNFIIIINSRRASHSLLLLIISSHHPSIYLRISQLHWVVELKSPLLWGIAMCFIMFVVSISHKTSELLSFVLPMLDWISRGICGWLKGEPDLLLDCGICVCPFILWYYLWGVGGWNTTFVFYYLVFNHC